MKVDWERARGPAYDYNGLILLARSSVAEFAGALAIDAIAWERDVLGREVVLRRDAMFVFRLRGHHWSIAVGDTSARTPYFARGLPAEKALSLRLDAPLLIYSCSDTCGTYWYTSFLGGEVVEDFFGDSGDFPDADGGWDDDAPIPPGVSYFRSTRREIGLDQIPNLDQFVERLLMDQDVFDPGITFEYFFDHEVPKPGHSGAVVNRGFRNKGEDGRLNRNIPPIERVDYIVFRNGSGEEYLGRTEPASDHRSGRPGDS